MSHTVEILSVGTELLLGNIANTDAQMLSQGLSELGLNVFWHTVVGDNLQRAEEISLSPPAAWAPPATTSPKTYWPRPSGRSWSLTRGRPSASAPISSAPAGP